MSLPSNQARFFDIGAELGVAAVRARVGSNRPDLVVTFQLIDTSTGEIVWADEALVKEQDVWATAN
jgi:PBP1b-binding outer membrane lipoprotein LpoB